MYPVARKGILSYICAKSEQMSLIEELKWRGMLQDIMPGTAEQLEKEPTTAYIGFDPTADSLHIGSLVHFIVVPPSASGP